MAHSAPEDSESNGEALFYSSISHDSLCGGTEEAVVLVKMAQSPKGDQTDARTLSEMTRGLRFHIVSGHTVELMRHWSVTGHVVKL